MTFGSLFSGIGGLDLGLTRAGLECRWQVEIDPWCRRVLVKHWPDVPKHDDVRTFDPGDGYHVDLVCGGDPCQGNSNAGSVHKREHEDFASHFLRVVDTVRPRFVLRENPSVTRPGASWPWQRFRAGLESLGYAVLPFRLRSCCVGLDHQRERLFLLAELPDPNGERLEGIDWQGIAAGHTGRACCDRDGRPGGPAADRLPTPRLCRGADGVPNRVERLRALGNAVPPPVAEWIGRRLIRAAD